MVQGSIQAPRARSLHTLVPERVDAFSTIYLCLRQYFSLFCKAERRDCDITQIGLVAWHHRTFAASEYRHRLISSPLYFDKSLLRREQSNIPWGSYIGPSPLTIFRRKRNRSLTNLFSASHPHSTGVSTATVYLNRLLATTQDLHIQDDCSPIVTMSSRSLYSPQPPEHPGFFHARQSPRGRPR